MNSPAIAEMFSRAGIPVALADSAARAAALLLLAALVAPAFRKFSAAARHALWSGALAAALFLPLLSFTLPAWRVAWLPSWPATPVSAGQLAERVPSPASFSRASEAGDEPLAANRETAVEGIVAPPAAAPIEIFPTTAIGPIAAAANPVPQPAARRRALDAGFWFPLWIGGALLALLPVAAGWLQATRLTRRARALDTPEWAALLAETARALDLHAHPRLLAAPGATMPFTWGALRPAVVFPADAADWPAARRRLVLLHELSHIRRRDWLAQTLASLACALHWFNPLAWHAARQMRLEREQACDDLVLRSGQPAPDYARELLAFAAASSQGRFLSWTTVPMARSSTLEARLRAILDRRRKRAALTRTVALALAALVLAVAVPLAMLRAAAPAIPSAAESALRQGHQAADAKHWADALKHFEEARMAAPSLPAPLFALGMAEAQLPGRELRAIGWLRAGLALAPDAPEAADARAQIPRLDRLAEERADTLFATLDPAIARIPDPGPSPAAAQATNHYLPTNRSGAQQMQAGVTTILKEAKAARPAPLPPDVPLTAAQRAQSWVEYVQHQLSAPLFLDHEAALAQANVVPPGETAKPEWAVFSQLRADVDLWIASLAEVRGDFPEQRLVADFRAEKELKATGTKFPALAGLLVQLYRNDAMKLVPISAGTFLMGSPVGDPLHRDDEGPQTRVTLTKDFFLGATAVTQAQYQAVMGVNPSFFLEAGKNAPVEHVTWSDAMAYCRQLTRRERAAGRLPPDYAFTLPTEAQWEYACRAGKSETALENIDTRVWDYDKGGRSTHPVGLKQANAWGLYDMPGNVTEWCWDLYGYYPGGVVDDPVGAHYGDRVPAANGQPPDSIRTTAGGDDLRVLRGNGWFFNGRDGRHFSNTNRSGGEEHFFRNGIIGFRIALVSGSAPHDAADDLPRLDAARVAAPDLPAPLFALGLAEGQIPGRELRAIGWLRAALALAPAAPEAAAARAEIARLDHAAEVRADSLAMELRSAAQEIPGPVGGTGNQATLFDIPTNRSGAAAVMPGVTAILNEAKAARPAPPPADVRLTTAQRAQSWVNYVLSNLSTPIFVDHFAAGAQALEVPPSGTAQPAWTVFSQHRALADSWITGLAEVRGDVPEQRLIADIRAEQERKPIAAKFPALASVLSHLYANDGITLVPIPAGTFLMGSPADASLHRDNEGPQTRVTLTQDFFLGATPVTQAQYQAVTGVNPSFFLEAGKNRPVEHVSWNDALAYCEQLTARERAAGRLPPGYVFTLPTEAQWEYASRAGKTGTGVDDFEARVWYWDDSGHSTQPVGLKQPNTWGLYDMPGNVTQWCLDIYGVYPGGAVSDPVGAFNGDNVSTGTRPGKHVIRGLSWYSSASPKGPTFYSNTFRSAADPTTVRNGLIGFRIALVSGSAPHDAAEDLPRLDDARVAAPDLPAPLFALGLAEGQIPGRELRAIGWLRAALALAPAAPEAAAARAEIARLDRAAEDRADHLVMELRSDARQIPGTTGPKGNQATTHDIPTNRNAAEAVLPGVTAILNEAKAARPGPPPADVRLTAAQRAQAWVNYVLSNLSTALFVDHFAALAQVDSAPSGGTAQPAWTVFSQHRALADSWITGLAEVRGEVPEQRLIADIRAEQERKPIAAKFPALASVLSHLYANDGITLVPIPAGTFLMGSPADDPLHKVNEGPQTRVTLTQDFFLGATPVTQAQFQAVTGVNPSFFLEAGKNRPVEHVSWNDALAYCEQLTARERAAGRLPPGYVFTLPTEAQWEYASRAGKTGTGVDDFEARVWYGDNSGQSTQPVGLKQPNTWGLYDMPGDVVQWCLDLYGSFPGGAVTDPTGAAIGDLLSAGKSPGGRVLRGLNWFANARNGAIYSNTYRSGTERTFRNGLVGFRIALVAITAPTGTLTIEHQTLSLAGNPGLLADKHAIILGEGGVLDIGSGSVTTDVTVTVRGNGRLAGTGTLSVMGFSIEGEARTIDASLSSLGIIAQTPYSIALIGHVPFSGGVNIGGDTLRSDYAGFSMLAGSEVHKYEICFAGDADFLNHNGSTPFVFSVDGRLTITPQSAPTAKRVGGAVTYGEKALSP